MTAILLDSRSARRGFTLAELVIVMVIIATLASIAVPKFASASATYRADGAARQLAAAIEDAAVQARARSTTIRVRISRAGNNFNAAVRDPLTYIALYNTTDAPFEATVERTAIANAEVGLDIDGFGNYSTAIIVELKAGSRTRVVWVNPDTGMVHVGSVDEGTEFYKSGGFR